MNPTTTAPAVPSGGGDDARSKYARQIEEAFETAGRLAGSALPPTDFYREFLNRTLSAIDAPAGAVWLRTPQGFLQLACQENIDKMGLDARRGGRQCHNEVLRQVFQAAPPRPVLLEPNGRMAPGPGEPGPVPPANLTDHFALFAPIVTPEKQTLGILEVFQDAVHDPRMYPTFLNYAFQMAGYASQYHSFSNARVAAGIEKTYTQVESFARHIHSSLNPTEVAYHVANEGRKLIECDRLCVGVRHDRKRVTVEAVSGADVVEKASTHVRRLRLLMQAVLQWGETLTFKGEKDPGLPPDVSHALDDYLHESQPKLLIVQPIRDEREKDSAKPARGVLVMEVFNPPEQTEALVQRFEIVAKHAAPALYNAAEMKRVPLKFLWWPIAKVQEGLGGKSRFITAGIVLLVVVLATVMALVPAPLRVEAKGQMLPVEIAKIYPPREGVVRDIRAKPGQRVNPNYELVTLSSDQLSEEYNRARGEWLEQNMLIGEYNKQIQSSPPEADKRRIEADRSVAEGRRDKARGDMEALDQQYNRVSTDPSAKGQAHGRGPGFFRANAPDFGSLARAGGDQWTVLNNDNRESLLGRTMRPNEEMLRIAHLEGPWHLELKIPQRNVGQVLRAFADPAQHLTDPDRGGRKYLEVDVILRSQAATQYKGRLYREDLMAEAVPNKNEHDENEPVVTAYVKLNIDGIDPDKWIPREQLTTGLEVNTRIRCGDHALGYTLFHGVWEWFYEKVIFFF
ncbi:hypothetical protein GobsT_69060 [Gemmata obscuriglobus]|uniref:Hemolysin D n=1 Tax=Gemmata obscuriglobus TaxID=114 RepID=A0A2Z3HC30_9BACT|nr:hypothetical protein [Gemmata obscuriglobus]AWM41962.1 hypothetical protein C1280_36535 [Gemmata obscuriglobus]QEG32056.1 hypothetical protein GobsT_69060 [Gemmata obscuriglobus]VTS11407.1 Alkaline proteinase secretion protein aprE-like OS=Blastopirellula marina DSM 3645 GN=DSM3645_23895 PE=4 SV=1 [Gemmata obscuriglobus UQM 2246]